MMLTDSDKGLQKIRVLFVSHDCGAAGAELSLLSLLEGLDRERFEPYAILPCAGKMKGRLEEAEIKVRTPAIEHWIPSSSKRGFRHLWRFVSTLRSRVSKIMAIVQEYEIDIVYTNTITVIDGAIAARLAKKPHIWHARERYTGNNDLKSYIPGRIVKYLIRALSDTIIVNSYALASFFDDPKRISKVFTVHNGIDVHSIEAAVGIRIALQEKFRIPADITLVGAVGRLSERKDQATLLRALGVLKSRGLHIACVLVGKGRSDYMSQLRQIASDLDIEQELFFLGERSDVPHLVKSFDILVLSSQDEPFGRVLIEAMAAGKPVVATRSGGPAEIVVEGETGYLVPIADHEAMADRLRRLVVKPEDALKFGEAGRQRVNELFRLETYVCKIQDIITKVYTAAGRSG